MTADLAMLLHETWNRLSNAAGHPEAEWGLPVLATMGENGSPRQRTVVLRGVDASRCRIDCYCDRRSSKVAEIQREPRTSWLFYDRQERIQAVLSGMARLENDEELIRRSWEACSPESRRNYMTDLPPGQPLAPHLNDRLNEPLDVTDAFQNFAVMTATITFIDWLKLEPGKNRRAQFHWTIAGWSGTWVHP